MNGRQARLAPPSSPRDGDSSTDTKARKSAEPLFCEADGTNQPHHVLQCSQLRLIDGFAAVVFFTSAVSLDVAGALADTVFFSFATLLVSAGIYAAAAFRLVMDSLTLVTGDATSFFVPFVAIFLADSFLLFEL